MKISEAAELTGLSISNIRFYEKKGLLEPGRDQQSKYRDYTQEDIYRLKQIMLYRKMDMSIETICVILNKEPALEPILEQQICVLKEKKEKLQGSIDLCEEILLKCPPKPFDIDYYLDYVKKEEEKGRKFAEIEELLGDIASYTKFDMLSADPLIGRFLRNPGVNRLIRGIWAAAIILLPVFVIVDGFMDDTGISFMRVVYWMILLVVLWGPFIRFRKG